MESTELQERQILDLLSGVPTYTAGEIARRLGYTVDETRLLLRRLVRDTKVAVVIAKEGPIGLHNPRRYMKRGHQHDR